MHRDSDRPPPAVGIASGDGETQIWFTLPDGWLLPTTVVAVLRRVFSEFASPGQPVAVTVDWVAGARGGFCWCRPADVGEVVGSLRRIIRVHMERDREGGAA